jgi:hypothetical protein
MWLLSHKVYDFIRGSGEPWEVIEQGRGMIKVEPLVAPGTLSGSVSDAWACPVTHLGSESGKTPLHTQVTGYVGLWEGLGYG